MNDDSSLPPRHLLNKRIELARDFFGNLCLYCEKCDVVTHEGEKWCCIWAKGMAWSYVFDRLQPAAEVLREGAA